MPRLGADMTAGKVVAWLKHPGEHIKRGEIIAVVETDKANVDVESFVSGVVERILVEAGGDALPVGTPLALIRAEEGAELPAEKGAPVAPPVVPPIAPTVIASAAVAVAAPASVAIALPGPAAGEHLRISPAARKRAQELALDASGIAGTGPDGRITLADVERAAQATKPVGKPADGAGERARRMRDAIATSMARSKREIPHYYLACTIDFAKATAWLAARNAGCAVTERLIYAVLLIKASALALREVPELNGFWIDGRAQQSEAIHTGIAISLRGGGLVAPALHHADQRSLDDLMRGFQDLVKRARAGSLKSSEMTDPTVTITSLGERGVESVFGIITPPQLALVGFGTPLERPWVVEGKVVARPLLSATLSGDHRATDGHRGALYLAAVDRLLQQPEAL